MEVSHASNQKFRVVVTCAAALLLSFTLPHAWAQKKPDAKTRSVEKNGDTLFSSASAPNADPVFAEKVKEYTTEKYFMTELVDHLPLSDSAFSGKSAGLRRRDAKQTHLHEGSLSLLSRAGERVPARARVHRARKSEEGREQIWSSSATKTHREARSLQRDHRETCRSAKINDARHSR